MQEQAYFLKFSHFLKFSQTPVLDPNEIKLEPENAQTITVNRTLATILDHLLL